MKNIILIIIAIAFSLNLTQAQRTPKIQKNEDTILKRGQIKKKKSNCKNHLINPRANKALNGWQRTGSASVNRKGRFFTMHSSSANIRQDVKIPVGAKFAYLGGYTRNTKKSKTAHGYLYAYVMDSSGKILDYIQPGVQNRSLNWKYQSDLVDLTAYKGASKIRFFLMQSSKVGVKNNGNIAHFDNLMLTFDCKRKPPVPKANRPSKKRPTKVNATKRGVIE